MKWNLAKRDALKLILEADLKEINEWLDDMTDQLSQKIQDMEINVWLKGLGSEQLVELKNAALREIRRREHEKEKIKI